MDADNTAHEAIATKSPRHENGTLIHADKHLCERGPRFLTPSHSPRREPLGRTTFPFPHLPWGINVQKKPFHRSHFPTGEETLLSISPGLVRPWYLRKFRPVFPHPRGNFRLPLPHLGAMGHACVAMLCRFANFHPGFHPEPPGRATFRRHPFLQFYRLAVHLLCGRGHPSNAWLVGRGRPARAVGHSSAVGERPDGASITRWLWYDS